MSSKCYLGIDVGSVSTNIVAINNNSRLLSKVNLRTEGQPIRSLICGLKELIEELGELFETLGSFEIGGVGTTGSGRHLAGIISGADTVKNEITAHAVAASHMVPGVQTILEIGGQDSKIIILRNGVAYDFAMNTVCAAGTGSFLDRQAARLNIPIEEFGKLALKSTSPVRIAGRCAVFAESDMIHKQQAGHSNEDIVAGLCIALASNFLNNLAKGKDIREPVVFQGGVAANAGIVNAFKQLLHVDIIIPEYFDVMGAYGAALIAKSMQLKASNFKGFDLVFNNYEIKSIDCNGCSNCCEVMEIKSNKSLLARWGDRCGKWSNARANFC
ncbi:MAG: acyl-CoA dehydratase activase [Eubacteriales bacterium]|nr:acyl-CoA dehydratase activase [Eubacteriales bacterium]